MEWLEKLQTCFQVPVLYVAGSLTVSWEVLLSSVGHILRFSPSSLQPALIEHLLSTGVVSAEQRYEGDAYKMRLSGAFFQAKT